MSDHVPLKARGASTVTLEAFPACLARSVSSIICTCHVNDGLDTPPVHGSGEHIENTTIPVKDYFHLLGRVLSCNSHATDDFSSSTPDVWGSTLERLLMAWFGLFVQLQSKVWIDH